MLHTPDKTIYQIMKITNPIKKSKDRERERKAGRERERKRGAERSV